MLENISYLKYKSICSLKTPWAICIENEKESKSIELVSLMKKIGNIFDKVLCFKIKWNDYILYHSKTEISESHKVKFFKDKDLWYEKSQPTEEELIKCFNELEKLYLTIKYKRGYNKMTYHQDYRRMEKLSEEKNDTAFQNKTRMNNLESINKLNETINIIGKNTTRLLQKSFNPITGLTNFRPSPKCETKTSIPYIDLASLSSKYSHHLQNTNLTVNNYMPDAKQIHPYYINTEINKQSNKKSFQYSNIYSDSIHLFNRLEDSSESQISHNPNFRKFGNSSAISLQTTGGFPANLFKTYLENISQTCIRVPVISYVRNGVIYDKYFTNLNGSSHRKIKKSSYSKSYFTAEKRILPQSNRLRKRSNVNLVYTKKRDDKNTNKKEGNIH